MIGVTAPELENPCIGEEENNVSLLPSHVLQLVPRSTCSLTPFPRLSAAQNDRMSSRGVLDLLTFLFPLFLPSADAVSYLKLV